ncbi:hypothetical protein HS088_TW22G01061 [Tripterygium wilfordii]|uniref:Uncharacterized protein n=1 Tax=Tripterygium wilfordii TaxID=458696 RepID=A0A7J7BZU3_TRIWF|nr:hypothetical protein HS088_TW22G01061 [Tripterygium wilfordii]
MANHVEATKYIHPGVLDPCQRSGPKPPFCQRHRSGPPSEANKYHRGCSAAHRCRTG